MLSASSAVSAFLPLLLLLLLLNYVLLVGPAPCFVFCSNSFAKAIWWWMLLYRTLRKVTFTNMRKNVYNVTPRCAAAAAAVVSAVVLRRPTKEYTLPYSMMHRRLPTAGVEVRPPYHQFLVISKHENRTW